MVHVREVTYAPKPEGGRIRAMVSVGPQELTATWPVTDQDADLTRLLEQMQPSIEEVMLTSGSAGRELRMTMTIGAQEFVARMPVDASDEALQSSFDQLLERVNQQFTETLRASLAETAVSSP